MGEGGATRPSGREQRPRPQRPRSAWPPRRQRRCPATRGSPYNLVAAEATLPARPPSARVGLAERLSSARPPRTPPQMAPCLRRRQRTPAPLVAAWPTSAKSELLTSGRHKPAPRRAMWTTTAPAHAPTPPRPPPQSAATLAHSICRQRHSALLPSALRLLPAASRSSPRLRRSRPRRRMRLWPRETAPRRGAQPPCPSTRAWSRPSGAERTMHPTPAARRAAEPAQRRSPPHRAPRRDKRRASPATTERRQHHRAAQPRPCVPVRGAAQRGRRRRSSRRKPPACQSRRQNRPHRLHRLPAARRGTAWAPRSATALVD
mmetsp:Transcript_49428/g.142144  ORF Transcript_49428/g.142144 Transcript_49428/m.142144 type:complete len:318 (+) Transcript_49428:6-959(+)